MRSASTEVQTLDRQTQATNNQIRTALGALISSTPTLVRRDVALERPRCLLEERGETGHKVFEEMPD
jgi:hypothetical protein